MSVKFLFSPRSYASEQDTPRVEQMRHDYRRRFTRVDIRNLVFVDEAGVNLSLTRLYGRAVGGNRVIDSTPRNVGQNVSLIGGLTTKGLIASMTVNGSVLHLAQKIKI